MDEYDFGFLEYRPQWHDPKAIVDVAAPVFQRVLGEPLTDVGGVVSASGWNPNWPLILRFSTMAVSINTKCDYLWTVEKWGDWAFDPAHAGSTPELPLSYGSVLDRLSLGPLAGLALTAVYFRTSEEVEGFALVFGERSVLAITDGGDELKVDLLSSEQWDAISSQWQLICGST